MYHINAVDEVTPFEVICTVEKISEHYLIPALEQLLDTFPFTVLGFNVDNGSAYLHQRVTGLLEKWLIEFTQSRSRQSHDNALAESKQERCGDPKTVRLCPYPAALRPAHQ